ncbi:MAG: hypothetical protein L0099_11550, partial [Acidobacteria bacterium]|nr:hypothetical protein [Acidobacteriota bacterium]
MKLTWKARAGLTLLAVVALLCVSSSGSAQRPKADVAAPTATGKVVAYEVDKSITVEVKQRGGEAKKLDFAIVKDKTKVELLGRAKAIELGAQVRVWADKDNPKTAARITAGTPQRRRGAPPAPAPPARPKEEANKQPTKPATNDPPPPVPDKAVATVLPTLDKNKGTG